MTLPEIEILAKVQSEKLENDNESNIYYQHLGGYLAAVAFHDPKKYPSYESLLPSRSRAKMESHIDAAIKKAKELKHI